MSEPSFDDLVAGLRAWARGRTGQERAAVELLIWKEDWLRRRDFREACTSRPEPDLVTINWAKAQIFAVRGYALHGGEPVPSSSQLRILEVAVALGTDLFGIAHLGHAHKRAVAQAFAEACCVRLEPPVPEAGHSHPDFIPGDPATCHRCALEGADEGLALPGGGKEGAA